MYTHHSDMAMVLGGDDGSDVVTVCSISMRKVFNYATVNISNN